MNVSNENELVRRLRNDDVQAFDRLYYKYHQALLANIHKLTRNTIASEDILQEVFIALWEKRATLDPDDHIAGWLFVVSYNKAINFLRKELREAVGPLDADDQLEAPGPDINLFDIQARLLQEAVSRLSPQKRRVFELCKIHGKTYEETARELHISKHTVKEYLVMAVDYVKTYVRQHPEYRSSISQLGLLMLLSSL